MKVRIKFAKSGAMKFIGHLDIMRYFQKAMKRADIPVAYTGGFSPHQIMSFASPLGVGITSRGEYMDIEITAPVSSKEAIKELNAQMADGITILGFKELPENAENAMSSVAAASYAVNFREGYEPGNSWRDAIIPFFNQKSIPIIKETKKNKRELDLKKYIYSLELVNSTVHMCVAAGSVVNIKPELVMEAFSVFAGFTIKPFSLLIEREELYLNKGADNNTILEPLDAEGVER